MARFPVPRFRFLVNTGNSERLRDPTGLLIFCLHEIPAVVLGLDGELGLFLEGSYSLLCAPADSRRLAAATFTITVAGRMEADFRAGAETRVLSRGFSLMLGPEAIGFGEIDVGAGLVTAGDIPWRK